MKLKVRVFKGKGREWLGIDESDVKAALDKLVREKAAEAGLGDFDSYEVYSLMF